MKPHFAALLEEALALPAKDRRALAEALLVSLDGDAEDDTASAWKAEIEKRVKELDEGTVATIPWPEVRVGYSIALVVEPFDGCEGFDLQWMPAVSRDDLHRR
jgi:putative addiction module component (TIGR02574 family)